MVRKASSRVVLNRAALNELHLGLGDGIEEVARTIIETADPPDATPFGVGLVKSGGWLVYSGSKKVGGGSLGGTQPKKPRSFRPNPSGITGMAGFGFPGRFQETGTAHHGAQPFLMPAAQRVLGHAGEIIGAAVRARLG